MSLNALDLLLLALLLFAAVRGARRGALSQLATFGGAALGLVLGAAFAPRLAGALISGPSLNLALLTLGFLLLAIVVGQGIGFAVGLRVQERLRDSSAVAVDRVGGVLVGLVAVLLSVWLLGSALAQGPVPAVARQIEDSRIVGALGRTLPRAPDVLARGGTYLRQSGFPEVFAGLGGGATAPPVGAPDDAAVAAAQAAGTASTVQVQSTGCGGISSGSGFVTSTGFVVTNAHVIAGGGDLTVRDGAGVHPAIAVHFDPQLDLAVIASPEMQAPPIAFTTVPAGRGATGATLGFPGGDPQLVVEPAAVRARGRAVGRDIYGQGLSDREVLTLSAGVVQGDSGGPFVTAEGLVGGVVFAASSTEPDVGFALTAASVRDAVAAAIASNQGVGVGRCRF